MKCRNVVASLPLRNNVMTCEVIFSWLRVVWDILLDLGIMDLLLRVILRD